MNGRQVALWLEWIESGDQIGEITNPLIVYVEVVATTQQSFHLKFVLFEYFAI